MEKNHQSPRDECNETNPNFVARTQGFQMYFNLTRKLIGEIILTMYATLIKVILIVPITALLIAAILPQKGLNYFSSHVNDLSASFLWIVLVISVWDLVSSIINKITPMG